MSSKAEAIGSKSVPEKGARFLRDINIIGAVALGGAGIALESGILIGWGALNAGQAGFFEVVRRAAAKRQTT